MVCSQITVAGDKQGCAVKDISLAIMQQMRRTILRPEASKGQDQSP